MADALLALFRHGPALDGYDVVALLLQERRGRRAGWVQTALVGLTVALGVLVASVGVLSVAGAVVLSLVLALAREMPGTLVAAP